MSPNTSDFASIYTVIYVFLIDKKGKIGHSLDLKTETWWRNSELRFGFSTPKIGKIRLLSP